MSNIRRIDIVLRANYNSENLKSKGRAIMKRVWFFEIRIKRYPQLKQLVTLFNNKEKFEQLVSMRKELPNDMYTCYLRICYQFNTYHVPLQLLLDAFEGVSKKQLMDRKEFASYKKLPEKITIYRGTDRNEQIPRLSWSLNKETAMQYSQGRLFVATIKKTDIMAYFCSNTNEEEIVAYVPEKFIIMY